MLWFEYQGFPCHLYYDLEFDKRANPIKDVDEMVDILLSITFNALRDKYSIDGDRGWVVELDSSTEGMPIISCTSYNK